MSYLGRATDIKFEIKLNGTHTLTFQLPDKYFDSEKGDYVRNEFVDNLSTRERLSYISQASGMSFILNL